MFFSKNERIFNQNPVTLKNDFCRMMFHLIFLRVYPSRCWRFYLQCGRRSESCWSWCARASCWLIRWRLRWRKWRSLQNLDSKTKFIRRKRKWLIIRDFVHPETWMMHHSKEHRQTEISRSSVPKPLPFFGRERMAEKRIKTSAERDPNGFSAQI